MKLLITESQLDNLIVEGKTHTAQLCSHFGTNKNFCEKVARFIENNRGNTRKKSFDFFTKVLRESGVFKTIDLLPDVKEYEDRKNELINFKQVLEKNNSCPNIVQEVEKDLENLPKKGLKMVTGESQEYDLLNRLDTHPSAKAFLLTRMILDSLYEERGEEQNLSSLDDNKIIELTNFVLSDENVLEVAENLKKLIDTNEHFRKDLIGTISYSKQKGNQVEDSVFDFLREKYGSENVYVYSNDFGFVDYFGVDGVVVFDGQAHPIQISTKPKTPEPKLFKFTSERCQPKGYFKTTDRIITYYPV